MQLNDARGRDRATDFSHTVSITSDLAEIGRFAIRLPARSDVITDARHRLGAWLHVHYLVPDLIADILLAASELINNSVEHGYRHIQHGVVRLTARLDRDFLTLGVADTGNWQPPLIGPSFRGHGLIILRGLCSSVTIEHTDPGTRVSAEFRLHPAS